ncbi:MAG: D-aminoacyl-tRNA deacylase [Syntrophomonas sp.]|uniref:D-aminoacyl-tRNA deacylase n=1 Tax=Syntrophomonas sp. TaxID=2053627 RepID=UPI002609CB97|nr:D-aminoacyl-tRNA deacylase [Syntrophomonas sp.]MDD4625708.1 D-aminoacyl-tRNA deacylase [Syntrophomonas sp.]
MRAIVQRVSFSTVRVEGELRGRIKQGLMVLLGIKKGDNKADGDYLVDKMVNLRIFPDEEGKMNRSLLDIQGELLLVSQFTLYGDARKGRRPSFSEAELPELAEPLFDYCVDCLRNWGVQVETGTFGAEMSLSIENDGPCTILLDSEKLF